mmetsp:Transcript_22092/g.40603  ORF Transcript_22092/g.40603 Transcript_22092/m.40603 type:complete len:85 (+) Transcript_22092:174-428(+)
MEEELAGDTEDPREPEPRPNRSDEAWALPPPNADWCLLCLEMVAFLGVGLLLFLLLASRDDALGAELLDKDGNLKPAKLTMLLL